MLTSIMTILATTLMAFAIATIASAPSPRFSPYSNPYSHFSPSSSMETVEGGLSGGAIMAALIGGILVGVLLQYVVTLFSRANIGYFFGRKPVLSSMLIPRLASILGVLFIVATIIGICALKGVMIVVGILVLVCLFYLVWLHLNCNRIFVDINEQDASGSSDLIGYMMYGLRYMLVAGQTLTPLWLLVLSLLSCSIIFAGDGGSSFAFFFFS